MSERASRPIDIAYEILGLMDALRLSLIGPRIDDEPEGLLVAVGVIRRIADRLDDDLNIHRASTEPVAVRPVIVLPLRVSDGASGDEVPDQ